MAIHSRWYRNHYRRGEINRGAKKIITTTTSTGAGSQTSTTTTCEGLGSCGGSIVCPSSSGGLTPLNMSDDKFLLHNDLALNAKLAVAESGDILLLTVAGDNPLDVVNRFFYSDYIYFLSESYTVNDPNSLSKLGLSSPFTIQAANYPVYTQDNMKYIVVGHK